MFDEMTPDDLVLAFFPCTRFEDQILLSFRGDSYQMKNYTDEQKLEYDLMLHDELHRNYKLITMLAIVAIRKGFRMVIENPYSEQHYLKKYWCIKPKLVDTDRRANGDYMKKPTQYFFINMEPKYNLVFEAIDYVERRVCSYITSKTGEKTRAETRSEIHPQYANRFIRQYLIDQD